ncbi:MAG TPA: isoprenylcysteine carboxylmethyltransferase family protein [candidate division Zixibacteria bacterium]|nr:isoprenylcysteine carboxylmethyltransferase family protein [candidate division Zixibacteria bacterium]
MKSYPIIPIISFFWVVSEIALAFVKRSKSSAAKGLDRASLRILWITIVVSIMIGVFFGVRGIGFIYTGRIIFYLTGLAFIVIGLIIRWIAILTLRRYFTVDVAIIDEHKIIDRGIYGHIRHPAYAGSLLSFLGLGLAYSNWLSILIIFIPILLAFLYRIRVEEAALITAFGDSYKDYSARTRRLLPGIF